MGLYIKENKIVSTQQGIDHDGFITYNATDEMMREWGYVPYTPKVISPTSEEIDERIKIRKRIEELKNQLADTDYIALKAIEGYDCDALYPGWKQQRRELRDMINELE